MQSQIPFNRIMMNKQKNNCPILFHIENSISEAVFIFLAIKFSFNFPLLAYFYYGINRWPLWKMLQNIKWKDFYYKKIKYALLLCSEVFSILLSHFLSLSFSLFLSLPLPTWEG